MRPPRLARFLAAALLGLAGLAAAAAAPLVELDPGRQPQRLAAGGETWLDEAGTATVEDVAQDAALPWRALAADTIHPLARGKVLWIRFTLRTAANPGGERWYLEVPYAGLDRVTLFSPDAAGRWVPASAGDLLPVDGWAVPHRHPLLPLATRAGGTRTLYVRVENNHSFSAPIQFVSDGHHSLAQQRSTLLLGIYFGLAALTIVLAVLGAVTLRDHAFAWCAVTVAAMAATQAAMTGIAGLHLWPRLPWWNDVSHFVLPVLAAGAICGFMAAVISLRQRSPVLHAVVAGFGLLALPLAAAILLADPAQRYRLMLPYLVAVMPVLLLTLAWALRRGDRYAGWVLAGSLPLVVGVLLSVARTAGLIPASFWTQHGTQIALALVLPVLMMMLLRRSEQRRDHGRRIQRLDRIDPATGLLNADVFHERLVRLIARSVRLKYRSAILLVEITNLDQIRRDFDRKAAQELPLRVAGRLLSAAREIDSVARLDDHRFGLLLEGPLKADEVAEAAPRVVARCLMPFKDRPLGWVPQVRVAQALIPKDGTNPTQLVAQLVALLESGRRDAKRSGFGASRPDAPLSAPLAL